MLSLITSHTQIPQPHSPFSRLNGRLVPSLFFVCNPKKRDRQYKKASLLGRFGLTEVRGAAKFGRNLDNSWCCWCTQSEGDVELEAEILDFMAKSEKPTMFPTKDELLGAGRLDLVEAIKKRGGWYSLGWSEENVGDNVEEVMDFDIVEFQRRVESCEESATSREHYGGSFSGDDKEDWFSSDANFSSEDSDHLQLSASASLGRPLQGVADEDSGIDGILSRLEKQRNSDFGINVGKNGSEAQSKSKDERDNRHFDATSGVGRTDLEENGRVMPGYQNKGMLDSSGGNIKHYTEPETWRTWSNQRAGFQHTEFEAAEICFGQNRSDTDKESYDDGTTVTTKEHPEDWDQLKEINYNKIRTRLQHLESELTTALHSLRSKRENIYSEEEPTTTVSVTGTSSDSQNLSDALEFQETEFMSAQERLRSIRAKLAVIEGKMALAIIDAQKIVEVKQKRIDDAHKALKLLRTTCIVWPSSAAEVLLTGSFDGWTTQRRMEKSKTGIFSVSLKLYPGRYEIKFIVDGKWKIDPLRPIINNNGYENNLLIVP